MEKEHANKPIGSLILIMINLFIIMIGIGIVIPVLPYYVDHFGASANVLGMLMAVYAFMQFLFAPFWGNLSDKIGRKPVIMIGLLGFAISQFLFASANELWVLFAARTIGGALGSALIATAMAYVSDVTTEEKRAQGMGMMGAAMGLGMVFGPGIGGWLSINSLSTPFLVAGIASTVAFIFTFIKLPESLTKEQREENKNETKQNQFVLMFQALKGPVGFLLMLVFVLSFALANFQSIFGFYALKQYGYDVVRVSNILVIVGIVGTIVQGALVGKMTKKFGEKKVIVGSLLVSAIGFYLMTLPTQYWGILLTVNIFFIANSLLRPAVNTLISKLAGPKQGMIMGLNNSFMSLGNVVGPLCAGYLFEIQANAPYFTGAIISMLALIATMIWIKKQAV